MYYMPPSTKVLRQRRSRSTASDRYLQQRHNVDPTTSTLPTQKPDPRLMSLQHQDRSKSFEIRAIGQPPRDELYRVSRRRIVGSVLGHEQEEIERQRMKEKLLEQERLQQEREKEYLRELARERIREKDRQREREVIRERLRERERYREQERVPSDEGIYLHDGSCSQQSSYSSESSLMSNPPPPQLQPKSSRRYRSAEPLLMNNPSSLDRGRFVEPGAGNRLRSASHTRWVFKFS